MSPSEPRPTLFLIAGPNGAGKTTFYETVLRPRIAAPFVNADIIQRDDLEDASVEASYKAAEIAAKRRSEYIAAGQSFVTETVFSHPSKLELLVAAKRAGFRVIVFHLHVSSADLSVARVEARVEEGGHPVPEKKVRERYARNPSLIRQAALMADQAAVYDASALNEAPKRLMLLVGGRVEQFAAQLPEWFEAMYGDFMDD